MVQESVAIQTATELYEVDADFRSLIAEWVRVKRCPYGMGDYLDEHDLPGPAVAARWAATEPDRKEWRTDKKPRVPMGIFPSLTETSSWFWWQRDGELVPRDNNDLHFKITNKYHSTAEAALLWLLDHSYWKGLLK